MVQVEVWHLQGFVPGTSMDTNFLHQTKAIVYCLNNRQQVMNAFPFLGLKKLGSQTGGRYFSHPCKATGLSLCTYAGVCVWKRVVCLPVDIKLKLKPF